ncbi:hypothetical protein HLB35_15585, partial [Halomonas sp. TBZ9]
MLNATQTPVIVTDTVGVSAGGAGVDVTVTEITLDADIMAALGTITNDRQVDAKGLEITAETLGVQAALSRDEHNNSSVSSEGTGASGAVIGISASALDIIDRTRVIAEIGASAAITLQALPAFQVQRLQKLRDEANADGLDESLWEGWSVPDINNADSLTLADLPRQDVWLTVDARQQSRVDADMGSYAGGGVVVGVAIARLNQTTDTLASIGDNVRIDMARGYVGESSEADQVLSVRSVTEQVARLNTQAIAGGLASGAGVEVSLYSENSVRTQVGESADIVAFNTDETLDLLAHQTLDVDGTLWALGAGLLSGAGAKASYALNPDTQVLIGENALLDADAITARATTEVFKRDVVQRDSGDSYNIQGEAYGLVSGAGLGSDITLSITTAVTVHDNAQLTARGEFNASDGSGDINLRAFNNLDIRDQSSILAGGLLAGTGATSSFNGQDVEASVTVGAAQLDARRDLYLAANTQANIAIALFLDAYGAVTVTAGTSEAYLTPVNSVTLSESATAEARGNTWLLAGRDSNRIGDAYRVVSTVDTLSGSLAPIDVVDAQAILQRNNLITVKQDAYVSSLGDITILAEDFDGAAMLARAKAVNWVNAALGGINSALGGTEAQSGNSTASSNGIVTINGLLETGRERVQRLVIDLADGLSIEELDDADRPLEDIFVAWDQFNDIGFTLRLANVETNLFEEWREAKARLAEYRGVGSDEVISSLSDEVSRIESRLEEQGFIDAESGAVNDPGIVEIVLDDIDATAGRIDIFADYLGGSGDFIAPRGSDVTIVNKTPAWIVVNNITIDDGASGFFYNGLQIENDSDIKDLNREPDVEDLAVLNMLLWHGADVILKDVAFGYTGASGAEDDATITIANTYANPDAELSTLATSLGLENSETDRNSLVREGFERDTISPSIAVRGAIYAPLAKATIFAGSDFDLSTDVNELTQGQTASINVGDLVLSAQDSINIGGVSRFTLGEAPYLTMKEFTRNWTFDADTDNPITEEFIEEQPFFMQNFWERMKRQYDDVNRAEEMFEALEDISQSTPTQARRINIQADVINLNGRMVSGVGEYDIQITESDEAFIERQLNRGVGSTFRLGDASNRSGVNMGFNPDTMQIEVQDAVIGGGDITIDGHLINTGNGKIDVFAGYGDINVDNRSRFAISLADLDVSTPGNGSLSITDRALWSGADGRDTSLGDQLDQVIIQRNSGGQFEVVHSGRSENASNFDQGTLSQQALVNGDFTYAIAENRRYAFEVAQVEETSTEYKLRTSSWIGIDALSSDPPDESSKNTQTLSNRLLPVGSG